MIGSCESLPEETNRVELAPQRDRFGMPLARAVFDAGDNGRALWRQAVDEGLKIFRAAGATEVWHSPPVGQHVLGGTLMGKDPSSSVVNERAQLHDAPNVVIGGPGVFPTSSAVNPTFTVHALAMRSARRLASHWPQFVR